jgi:hypothetical protein
MTKLVFSKTIDGHFVTVRFNETHKNISIEVDGEQITLVKIRPHGATAYSVEQNTSV